MAFCCNHTLFNQCIIVFTTMVILIRTELFCQVFTFTEPYLLYSAVVPSAAVLNSRLMVLVNSCTGPPADATNVCPKKRSKNTVALPTTGLPDLNVFDLIALFAVVASVVGFLQAL